jgi:heterodisulfide reductase subunit C
MEVDKVVLETTDLTRELAAASNIDLELACCHGCARCSSVCKAAIFSDSPEKMTPRSLLYRAIVGAADELIKSDFIWRCSGCRRCEEACPQNVMVSEAVRLLRRLACESGISNPVAARVNERVCMHCGACASVCPNRAITIIWGGPRGLVARVDPAECRGCGACSSVCSNSAIQQGSFNDRDILGLMSDGPKGGTGE